jgi:hypothetical protein
LISLHNYFIIHDIKYFFLNKINQTIRGEEGDKKKFQRRQTTENITEKHCFSKSRGGRCPPGLMCTRP